MSQIKLVHETLLPDKIYELIDVLCYCRFEGISWNLNETCVAYAAEEPTPAKPTFNDLGGHHLGQNNVVRLHRHCRRHLHHR